ncbi:MAG TPA: tail fiber domain-containing protein [Vicinamibacterales bacterium]|jgi:hypothetical protein
MTCRTTRRVLAIGFGLAIIQLGAVARASEIWVAPTYQQDFGGLGVGTDSVWPTSAAGVVRLAWSIPNDLQTFQSAKIGIIPTASGSSTLNVFVCAAQNGSAVLGDCAGPIAQTFSGVANQLAEIEIGSSIASRIGTAGSTYMAVLAFTSTASTDHVVGLRFGYTSVAPAGAAGLGANTFSATQTISTGDLDLGMRGRLTKNGISLLQSGGTLPNTASNLFVGPGSGNAIPQTGDNTGVGFSTLPNVTDGGGNTAVGSKALSHVSSGSSNTAVGASALALSLGNANTAIGSSTFSALVGSPIGNFDRNIAIGSGAGSALTLGSDNIYVANSGASTESGTIRIGGPNQSKTFVQGIRGKTTGAADAVPVVIDSNGQLGTVSSSHRFKEDIRDMSEASRRLFQLRPVTFRYAQPYANGTKPIQFGLIAEEVAEVFPELAVRGADGNVETVHYELLSVLLLNELQNEEKRLERLENQLNTLMERSASPR